MAKNTIRTYVGDGVTTIYSIDFALGYINRDYVYVHLTTNAHTDQVAYAWLNDSQIELTLPIEDTIEFTIRRVIPRNALVNDYVNGAILREEDLDNSFLQTLMIQEEIADGYTVITGDFGINSDLDMNGYRIKNLPAPAAPTDPLRLMDAAITGIEVSLRDLTTSTTVATTITVDATNDNDLIIIQSETPVVITLEPTTANAVVFFLQDTLQEVTFAAGVGAVVKTPLGLTPYTQNSMCFAYSINSTTWVLGGDLG